MRFSEDLCRRLEHYETPRWAARAILGVEPLIGDVLDPCTGTGILAEAAKRATNEGVYAIDIHDWGYPGTQIRDFLSFQPVGHDKLTVFMNPPFSKACEFVEHALNLGADKVIVFQRLAWYESEDRKEFFYIYPPDRIWLCGNRATSWRHDISAQERKERSKSSTAHAWFVWQRKSKQKYTTINRIWRDKGEKDE